MVTPLEGHPDTAVVKPQVRPLSRSVEEFLQLQSM